MTREQGTGNRKEILGNFTFRYLCRFFPFTYLNISVWDDSQQNYAHRGEKVNLGRVEQNEGSRGRRGGEGEDIFQAPRTKE